VCLLVVVLGALSSGSAGASDPVPVVTGEPTAEEYSIIDAAWRDFTNLFSTQRECLGTVEVRVVARAEDWYGGRSVGPIAAFYRFPPAAVVFVEHGKVGIVNLLHEFAHHMDISCGVAGSRLGRSFLAAQGLAADADWLTGPSWSRVPAENFAEAVVAAFGFEPSIHIERASLAVVWELVRLPLRPAVRMPGPVGHLDPAELTRAVLTESGIQLML
jgi:hypothetical protein